MASRYRVEQRHITHRGRVFHFVSYEGHPANPKRNQPASGHAWFLVNAGYRREVMPQEPGEAPEEVDRRLSAWIEHEVFAPEGLL
jgi:hypothetical protein